MITTHDLALSLGKIPYDAPIKFSLNGKIYDGCGILIQADRLSIFLKEEDDSFPAHQSDLFAGNSLEGGISFPIKND